MEEFGPLFIICRNRRDATEMKKRKLPEGSKVIVDPCALDNYISLEDREVMAKDAEAKDQMGVN
jgi:hypothetical protein